MGNRTIDYSNPRMEQTPERAAAFVPCGVGVAGPEAEAAHSECEAPSRLWGALTGEAALAHFERLGRALVETHTPEPAPVGFGEIIDRMLAIDPECGMGTTDPLGGDWQSHLAYIRNRRALAQRTREQRGPPR